jgi:hypothetical protein
MNTVTARADPELFERWRNQIARQRRRRADQGARPLAAIGYRVYGAARDGLVDLRRLLFITLYDSLQADGRLSTRVAGYGSSVIPWGVRIGGAENCKFDKDLSRPPSWSAKGHRIDLRHVEILAAALDLDRSIERHLQFSHQPWLRQPRWPTLWAAFDQHAAVRLQGAGPEFDATAQQAEGRPGRLLQAHGRQINGLRAYPLAFVSHAWQEIRAIYADVKTLPKRQIIVLDDSARDLCGFSEAIEFDLVRSRFSMALTPHA